MSTDSRRKPPSPDPVTLKLTTPVVFLRAPLFSFRRHVLIVNPSGGNTVQGTKLWGILTFFRSKSLTSLDGFRCLTTSIWDREEFQVRIRWPRLVGRVTPPPSSSSTSSFLLFLVTPSPFKSPTEDPGEVNVRGTDYESGTPSHFRLSVDSRPLSGESRVKCLSGPAIFYVSSSVIRFLLRWHLWILSQKFPLGLIWRRILWTNFVSPTPVPVRPPISLVLFVSLGWVQT